MQRLGVILVLAGVLGGCGSDSTKTATQPSGATTVAPAATATTKASGTSFAEVCSGRAAAKQPAQGQTFDYAKAQRDLQFAVDRAPSDIKADLTTIATPLLQYFRILGANNGNFLQAAQDPQFQTLAERFSQPDYQAAAQRVEAWFASHCN